MWRSETNISSFFQWLFQKKEYIKAVLSDTFSARKQVFNKIDNSFSPAMNKLLQSELVKTFMKGTKPRFLNSNKASVVKKFILGVIITIIMSHW